MQSPTTLDIAAMTTLRLGGPAARIVDATSADELVAATVEADDAGEPMLLVGGGSNLVVADEGFDGVVVRIRSSGIAATEADEFVQLVVAAGEPWDDVVARTVAEGLSGIECLSGIPGSSGATPIQNVGAYGASVDDVVSELRAWDRHERRIVEFAAAQCGFGYRTSIFKHDDRYVVLDVTFALRRSELSTPIRYAELARRLGVEVGERAPLPAVRDAVLELRRGKGMVLDPADPDSVSAGSFFTNPILEPAAFARVQETARARLGADVVLPAWTEADGRVKTSAAWLIERAGFGRGYGDGRAGLSSRHTLALVNRGGATTAELLDVARTIRRGVFDAFGVELHPEPKLVGVAL